MGTAVRGSAAPGFHAAVRSNTQEVSRGLQESSDPQSRLTIRAYTDRNCGIDGAARRWGYHPAPGSCTAYGVSQSVATGQATRFGPNGLGLSLKSQGQLASSTIQGNGDGIRLVFGSGLFVTQPSSSVSGNSGWGLQCTDGESSVINTGFLALSGNGAGGISPSCTAF
ncbi:MAG TPA: hypothetical protein VIW03_09990 [Anaeromyxobacter sp.]